MTKFMINNMTDAKLFYYHTLVTASLLFDEKTFSTEGFFKLSRQVSNGLPSQKYPLLSLDFGANDSTLLPRVTRLETLLSPSTLRIETLNFLLGIYFTSGVIQMGSREELKAVPSGIHEFMMVRIFSSK